MIGRSKKEAVGMAGSGRRTGGRQRNRARPTKRPLQPAQAGLVDEAYSGMLWAQWALAVANVGLGVALLLLEVDETQLVRVPFREGLVSVEWPTFGAFVRGFGASLLVGAITLPIVYGSLASRERRTLREIVTRDPDQLHGALNYVGNVG